MNYYLKERIGNPELFTGRRKELSFFLKWIEDIKEEKSKSTAMLARRKMGKSAILERLFNITFDRNDGIIPFYYEVKEGKKWLIDFARDFFLTFIYQYIAFKARKKKYLAPEGKDIFDSAKKAAKKESLGYLIGFIEEIEHAAKDERVDSMWEMVRNAPRLVAERQGEFILQIIDEFQFLNSEICRDKNCTIVMNDLAGSYLNTAESKISPILVSGSWVGWLMNLLIMQLPARFKFKFLKNMPEDEALEMIFKYSTFFEVPVTEETAYIIAQLSKGSPFYISSIIRSNYEDKDLTTIDGLTKLMEYETLSYEGEIKSTWMEYVTTAFYRVNDRNAKNIVLYLCKNREREVTRKELLENLNLDMTDVELEKKLKALVKADIIEQGGSNFVYRGVRDNIFDKVFRGVYQEEIEAFDVKDITSEYRAKFEEMKTKYRHLLGEYNYKKGCLAEYMIIDRLRFNAHKKDKFFKSITNNLPEDFTFTEYKSVWKYKTIPYYSKELEIDIFARAKEGKYSIVVEVKNRDTKKFSRDEAIGFSKKIEELIKIEGPCKALGFIFSRKGFTEDAEAYCKDNGIAYSSNEGWL